MFPVIIVYVCILMDCLVFYFFFFYYLFNINDRPIYISGMSFNEFPSTNQKLVLEYIDIYYSRFLLKSIPKYEFI